MVCVSKGDDGQYVIEKSSHRAHSYRREMIHRENGRKKENSSEPSRASEEDKTLALFVRNLMTHRNNFVDRFLRRGSLGDDLDASKLGSECKHDDVRER